MKTQPALIWDLDGTLIDSYQMIVPSLRLFYAQRGLELTDTEIREAVLRTSVRDFSERILAQTGISLEAEKAAYLRIRSDMERELRPMPGAVQTLRALTGRGVRHFLFTHRGASTEELLRRLGMADCFVCVLTAQSGFPRKPDPAGICYLMVRYDLVPDRTWYVGDRQMDMDCARAAGIGGVLLRLPDSPDFPLPPKVTVVGSLPELLTLPLTE